MEERRSWWYDLGWPVVAGIVAGVGLMAAYVWMGLATTVIALVLLELTFAPVAWSILTDLGYATSDVILRISPMWAVGSLAFVGLINLLDAWSLLVGLAILVTSPLVEGWSEIGFGGLLGRFGVGKSETERRFDDIVAHGFPGLPEDDLPR